MDLRAVWTSHQGDFASVWLINTEICMYVHEFNDFEVIEQLPYSG